MMDFELEQAIEAAGRPEVFALARKNGWGDRKNPPKYVWWQLVQEINASKITPPPTKVTG